MEALMKGVQQILVERCQKHFSEAVGGHKLFCGSARQNGGGGHDHIDFCGARGCSLLPKVGGRETSNQNESPTTCHGATQRVHQRIDVEQWKHTHQALIGLQVHAVNKRFCRQQITALAVHHTLRKPRGP